MDQSAHKNFKSQRVVKNIFIYQSSHVFLHNLKLYLYLKLWYNIWLMTLVEAPKTLQSTSFAESKSSEIVLPDKYRAALNLIDRTSRRLNIPYAVLGSIGVASVSSKGLTIPDFSGRWERGKTDIDIFVMSKEQQRKKFFSSVRSQLSTNSPLVDFCIGHHENIGFNYDEKPFLRYKKIHIPISEKLFNPIVNIKDPPIPALPPQTYIAMIMLCNNSTYPPRIAERIRLLIDACQQFPDINQELLKPFNTFKNEVNKYYPLHYPLIDVRHAINSNNNLQAIIDLFKNKNPKIIKRLRKYY